MRKNALSSGFERNALVEESILFRINQLQRGLLQFTDSTNINSIFSFCLCYIKKEIKIIQRYI